MFRILYTHLKVYRLCSIEEDDGSNNEQCSVNLMFC